MYQLKTLMIIMLAVAGWASMAILGTLAVIIGTPLVRLAGWVKAERIPQMARQRAPRRLGSLQSQESTQAAKQVIAPS